MPKQSRVQRKLKPKHRAVKPHFRPLDVVKEDNHAARHAAAKVKRAAHEALMAKQAEEKAAREAELVVLLIAALEPFNQVETPREIVCG